MSTDGSSGVGAASGEPRPRLGSRIVSVAEVIGPQTVVQWCDLWGTERNQQPALERAHGRRSCGGRRASTLTWRWGRSGCSSPSPAQVKLVFAGRTHQQERRSPLSRDGGAQLLAHATEHTAELLASGGVQPYLVCVGFVFVTSGRWPWLGTWLSLLHRHGPAAAAGSATRPGSRHCRQD
jgi:hypothetical protein